MAFDAGSVFVRLTGLFEGQEFDKWDRAVDQERVKSNTPIEQKLGADATNLDRDLAAARNKVSGWASLISNIKIGADLTALTQSLAKATALIDAWTTANDQEVKIKVVLDTDEAEAQLLALRAEMAALGDEPIRFDAGTGRVLGSGAQRLLGAGPPPVGPTGSFGLPNGTADKPFVVTVEAGRYAPGLGGRSADITFDPGYGMADRAGPAGGGSSITQPIPITPGPRSSDAGMFNQVRLLLEQTARSQREAIPMGRGVYDPNFTMPRRAPFYTTQDPHGGAGLDTRTLPPPWWVNDPNRPQTIRGAGGRFQRPWWAEPDAGLRGQSSPSGVGDMSAVDELAFMNALRRSGGGGDEGPTIIEGGGGGGGGGVPPVAFSPGGGGGGGGGIGNWLFGSGRSIGGGGRFGFGRFLSPFRWGIHGPLGAVGGAVGLGPEHILSAGLSVLGSGAGALGGAGVIGLGAAGTAAVGGGVDAAVLRSTITDTQQIAKAQEAVAQATLRYGAASDQAKQATIALSDVMQTLGNTAGVKAEAGLAKAADTLNDKWDKATSQARVQAVNILDQVVNLGSQYVPRVAKAAQENLAIINHGIKPLFSWLEGPQGVGIFNHLETIFKRNLPTTVHAFTQVVEALLKTINQAADFTGGFTRKLDELATRWNNMPASELHAKMQKLVDDFHIWSDMLTNLTKDLYYLFKSGAGEGNDLIVMFDNLLKRWGAWEKSAQGSAFLKQFFHDRKDELIAILELLAQVVKIYGLFYIALQPLVPAVTAFARILAEGLRNVVDLFRPVAAILGTVLQFFSSLGQQSSVFKDAFLLPLGAFLITWRKFGLESARNVFDLQGHFRRLGDIVGGVGHSVRTLFAEGPTAAWAELKGLFTGNQPQSAQQTMQEAIVTGGKEAATLIGDAMVSAGEKVAGTVEAAEVAGGTKAGAVIAGEEEAAQMSLFGGGVGARGVVGEQLGLAGIESNRMTPSAAQVSSTISAERAGVAGAGGSAFANLLGRARNLGGNALGTISRGGRALVSGLSRSVLPILAGLTAGSFVNAGQHSGNILEQVLGGAVVGGGAGATAGLIGGPLAPVTAPIGALIGGVTGAGAGLISGLLGVGRDPGPSRQQRALADYVKEIKNIKDPANLSAGALHTMMNRATELAREIPKASGQLNTLWHRLNDIAKPKDDWNREFNKAWEAVNHFVVRGGNSIKNLRDRFETNMRLIASTVGLNSDAGKKLAEKNFDEMINHVVRAMDKGKISVADGMAFMRSQANKGTSQMRDDLISHYARIVTVIQDAWKHGKLDTSTALNDLRDITNHTNQQIRDDIKQHYQKMLDQAKTAHDEGLLTDQQYANKRKSIHKRMGEDITGEEVTLSSNNARILNGMNEATGTAMGGLFKELNRALKALNVSQVRWTPFQRGIEQLNVGKIQQLVHHAGGGIIPGANRFGREDNMTLIDPHGEPVARMAGDEAIFNRHQMPYVEAGLQMVGFNGADDLWRRVNRPHGYESGGRLRKFAAGGYVYPFPAGTVIGRTDQGVDATMPVGAPIGPMGPARVSGIIHNWYQGQPLVWWQLLDGPRAGRYAFVAEQINDIAPPGTVLKPGQAVARYAGRGTGIEYGWATASGSTLARATTGYKEGQVTPAGQDMRAFISGLAHGRIVSGGFANGVGGFGANLWNDIQVPHIGGSGSAYGRAAQGALRNAVAAMNAYGESQGGGSAPGGRVSGSVVQWLRQAMKLTGVGGPLWMNMLERQVMRESGGDPHNINLTDSNARAGHPSKGLLQTIDSIFNKYAVSGHHDIWNPIDNAAAAIRYMIDVYGHGNAQTAAQVMWARGGGGYASGGWLPGFARGGGARRRPRHHQPAPRHSAVAAAHTRAAAARSSPTHTVTAAHTNPGTTVHTMSTRRPAPHRPPAHHPPARTRGATNARRPPAISRFLGNVPGLAQFAEDDAQVSRLDTLYSNQDTLFQMADPNGYTLDDLDTLVGIREKQWNILWGEYQALPGLLETLRQVKYGTRQASQPGNAPWHETPTLGRGLVRGPLEGGLNQEIGMLTGTLNQDEALLTHLQMEDLKITHDAQVSRRHVSARSLAEAERIMRRVAPLYNDLQGNIDAAIKVTDQIANIPVAKNLGRLAGNAYATAQRNNRANSERRSRLSATRSKVLIRNQGIRDQISNLNRERTAADLRLRHEGFAIAWGEQDKKYNIRVRIANLRNSIKNLKAKLAAERKIGDNYTDAINAIDARLHGPTKAMPDATGVKEELSTYGLDILGLHNQGAEVPNSYITNITKLLESMGLQVPAALSGGAAATPSGQAALQDFMNFQQDRSNLFAQFGSNFVAAGANPFAGDAGVAAGMQYFGAAAGPAGGGNFAGGGSLAGRSGPYTPSFERGGDTNFHIEHHYATAPSDPMTYSSGLRHELEALV